MKESLFEPQKDLADWATKSREELAKQELLMQQPQAIKRKPAQKRNPKIYIFLNGPVGDEAQYAAVAEDGYCLAAINVPPVTGKFAFSLLGRDSSYIKEYEKYYPDGYELVPIMDINAPQNSSILEFIRKQTVDRVREHLRAKSRKGN